MRQHCVVQDLFVRLLSVRWCDLSLPMSSATCSHRLSGAPSSPHLSSSVAFATVMKHRAPGRLSPPIQWPVSAYRPSGIGWVTELPKGTCSRESQRRRPCRRGSWSSKQDPKSHGWVCDKKKSIMTAARAKQHGLVDVKELERILDTCKLDLTPVDEVWPNLFIGSVWVLHNISVCVSVCGLRNLYTGYICVKALPFWIKHYV